MNILSRLEEKAKEVYRRIVFPESEDERVREAAKIIAQKKFAQPVLISDNPGLKIEGVEVINHLNFERRKEFINQYYNLRKEKGITLQEAEEALNFPLYFACMLVRNGYVDGCVAGAANTTASTIQAALRVIGLRDDTKYLSGFFLIGVPDCPYGENGEFLFADCAVIPQPNVEQLAQIAISTADSAQKLCQFQPKVAMLSFSTKGSSKTKYTKLQIDAVELVRKLRPDLIIDGELQLDAAIVPEVAQRKNPQGLIKGDANVLIFPDLNSGNIGYKMAERLARAIAIGPIFQGLKAPVNDLSRGCKIEDIVKVAAITALQGGGD